MPYFVEDTKDFTIYKIQGYFSFQDMEGLINHFDKLIETNPQARLLMDFSAQTGYEESTIKAAFKRMEEGFPPKVKIALVFEGGSTIYSHILGIISKAMPSSSKFFDSRAHAIKWLSED